MVRGWVCEDVSFKQYKPTLLKTIVSTRAYPSHHQVNLELISRCIEYYLKSKEYIQ